MRSNIFPSRELLKEGAYYLLSGIVIGYIVQNILHITPLTPPVTATPVLPQIALKKVGFFESLGMTMTMSIFFANLVSSAVIITYPEIAIRYTRGRDIDLHARTFPRVIIFSIGFLSIGLQLPLLTDVVLLLFFLFYLIPHAGLELFAIILAFSVPREYHQNPGRPFPAGRVMVILVLLMAAAVIETNVSLQVALYFISLVDNFFSKPY